jgi:hypothetical protein
MLRFHHLLAVALHVAIAAQCADDGADYTYAETVSGATRSIAWSGCPNHPTAEMNPNHAVKQARSYDVPATPEYSASQETDLSAKGGGVGITIDGALIFSAFAGPSYTLTGYTTSAPYLEGNTFDACGGHSSSTSHASYHYHVPPSCLLAQLGQTDGAHSPQIGWMADGFPVYGPLGPSGTVMKTCTVTGGTVGTDVCTDDCGGVHFSARWIERGTVCRCAPTPHAATHVVSRVLAPRDSTACSTRSPCVCMCVPAVLR